MRELTVTFTNWDINDMVVELARYINEGFRIVSLTEERDFHSYELEVTLFEASRT